VLLPVGKPADLDADLQTRCCATAVRDRGTRRRSRGFCSRRRRTVGRRRLARPNDPAERDRHRNWPSIEGARIAEAARPAGTLFNPAKKVSLANLVDRAAGDAFGQLAVEHRVDRGQRRRLDTEYGSNRRVGAAAGRLELRSMTGSALAVRARDGEPRVLNRSPVQGC